MYVTKPLSVYKSSPSLISSDSYPPAEGPNSGILIIQDEDSVPRCCFGLFKDTNLTNLPFPQDKLLQLYYTFTINTGEFETRYVEHLNGLLIPVINQPLSSNQYYLIKSGGKRSGQAITSSKEDDMSTCCFWRSANDIPPQPFDPNNAYQRFELRVAKSCGSSDGFSGKSVAADGIPPKFLKKKGWTVSTKKIKNLKLTEANGLNADLRARFPELKSWSAEPVVVGKWYCPFIFIREGAFALDTQMKTSMYYEMTLEQNWEQIFECLNNGKVKDNCVAVDVSVEKQVVLGEGSVAQAQAQAQSVNVGDGFMWVSPLNVGLSMAIVERVKWEEERVGFNWVGLGGKSFGEKERVRRREKYRGKNGEWRRFGCYVLVERFVLKRMDGSLVLTWDFKHTHKIATKWD